MQNGSGKDTENSSTETEEKGLTRRDVFGLAGMALEATALPVRLSATAPSPRTTAGPAPADIVNNYKMPGINLQYIVAVMLLNHTVTFHSANDTPPMTTPAVLRERVNYARGRFMNPMDCGEVAAKARDLVTPVLGKGKTEELIDKIDNLEKIKDVRELRPIVQTA